MKSKAPIVKTKIAVISDTHIPKQAEKLPDALLEELAKSAFIIHAGDFEDINTLKELQKLNRVIGVVGNMDSKEIRDKLKNKETVNVDHHKIGVIHGWGDPHKLPRTVLQEFKDDGVHCIVFGHSHQAFNEVIDGILMFNPGSPTDIIYAHYKSYGILETSPDGIKGQIIKLGESI
ncbi:MAG: metallophosphoesterase family protein [Candidatus Poribacteria bacterium]